MSIVVGLETAPDFPRQDLTDTNAQFLELLLANAQIVNLGHDTAEKMSWIYRVGHRAEAAAASRIFADPSLTEAFDYGIKSYETIASLVCSVPEYSDMFVVNKQAGRLIRGFSDTKLLDYIDVAVQRFTNELPNTTEVVVNSSQRFYFALSRYAVAGAALARQFELDGLE